MAMEKSLSIRLALLEKRIREMERLVSSKGQKGSFYSLVQDLSPREKEEMESLLRRILLALKEIQGKTQLPPQRESTSQLLSGMANVAFVSCLELEPKGMKGYGGDTPLYRELWEKELRPLKDLLHLLAQKAEEARKELKPPQTSP